MRRTGAVYRIVGMSAFAMSLAFGITLVVSRPVGFDFAAYLLAARRLLAGHELYPPSEQLVIGPFGLFLYPPPVALLFVPFAGLPTDVSRALWLGAGIALGVVLGLWCMRGKSTADRWYAGAAAALFFPLLWEIQLGNLTLLTTILCLFAHRLRERPATAGALLGLAIGLKLLPLTLLIFFIGAGRWRVALWATLVSIAGVILTWPFVGDEWSEFVRVLAAIASSGPAEGPNIAPAVFAGNLGRLILPIIALTIAALAGRASRGARTGDLPFALALATAPLIAGTVWYTYLVLALPLMTERPLATDTTRTAVVVGRPLAWLLMNLQLIPDTGRAFTLPFFGLALLVAIRTVEVVRSRLDLTSSLLAADQRDARVRQSGTRAP